MRVVLIAIVLLLGVSLNGCGTVTTVSTARPQIPPTITPVVSAFSNDQDAIDYFRKVTGLPASLLEDLGSDTMINSPHGDLVVTVYEDKRGGRYMLEPIGHILVDYNGRVDLGTAETPTAALTDEELSDRALQIAQAMVPRLNALRGDLQYGEGNKMQLHFYDWRSEGSAEWTMPPFVQVGLLQSGEVFAFTNTLTP